MKKLLSLLIAVIFILSLASCGNSSQDEIVDSVAPTDPPESAMSEEESIDKLNEYETVIEDGIIWRVYSDGRRYFSSGVIKDIDKLKLMLDYDLASEYKVLYSFFTSGEYKLEDNSHYCLPYDKLTTLKFSSFTINNQGAEMDIIVDFVVEESGWDIFEAGKRYSYTVSNGLVAFWINNHSLTVGDLNNPYIRLSKDLSVALSRMENGADMSVDTIVECVRMEESRIGFEHITPESNFELSVSDLKDYANQLLGVEDLDISGYYNLSGDKIIVRPTGKSNASLEFVSYVVDGDKTTVRIQLYADFMHFVKSHLCEFTFAEADNRYGYTLLNMQILERGADPYRAST